MTTHRATLFMQKTALFMSRFNCASNRIKKSNKIISCEAVTNYVIPGLRPKEHNTKNAHWRKADINNVHPLAFMLAGKRCIYDPISDLENMVGISGSIDTFRQGFLNIPTHKDCWTGYVESQDGYWHSLYFNLGRAFLKKFCKINLRYTLPPTYEKLFQELK